MKTHLIGIDPSFENFGIAVYNPESKRLILQSGNLFEGIDWLNDCGILHESIAVVENPALDKSVFGMWPALRSEFMKTLEKRPGYTPYPTGLAQAQSMFLRAMKQAQNIGEVKSAARLIIYLLRSQGVPVIEIAPSSRDRADKALQRVGMKGIEMLSMPTKTNAEQFQRLTGYQGRSNEHTRDAATLIHGRTIKWAEIMLQRNKETAHLLPIEY